jgi:PAS domain S-box-containing protein
MEETRDIQRDLFADDVDISWSQSHKEDLMERESAGRDLCESSRELLIRLNSAGVVDDLLCFEMDDAQPHAAAQYVGERVDKILEPDLAAEVMESLEDALKRDVVIYFEYSSVGPYGQRIFEVRVIPSSSNRATAVVRNVSENRNAKLLLMESEHRYRVLIEQSLQGIVLLQDFRIVYTNDAMTRISGYSMGELKGLTPEELTVIVHPDDRDMVWGRFRDRVNNRNVPSNYECRFVRKDGSVCWVEIFSNRIEYQGRPAIQVAVIDITGRKTAQEELVREKAYLEELFAHAPEAIVLLDNESRVLEVNEEFTRTFGYGVHEIRGKSVDDILAPPALKNEAVAITEKIKGGEPAFVETVRQRKDGSLIDVNIMGNPIWVNGRQVAVYGIYRDITEQKSVENALRESDEKYRGLFNNAQVGMFRSRVKDGKLLECNDRHAHIYGYMDREHCIENFLATEHYFDPGTREAMISELQQKGEIGNYEARFTKKDGSVIWVRFSARLCAEKGYLEGVIADISDEKKAIEEMGRSEEKYRILVENATDAIVIVQDAMVKFHNPKTEMLIGYSTEELRTLPFLTFVHEDDRGRVKDVYRRWLFEDEPPSTLSVRKVTKSGEVLWGEINAVRIVWEGKPALLCFIRDITTEKRLGAQLQQAQKMEAIGTLAGGIAHDFNNLLQAVLGYSDLLLINRDKEGLGYRELQGIRKAALRASELTQQLLTFSRKVESKLRPVNINNEVVQVLEILKRTIPKMVEIELRLEKNLRSVNADPAQIGQALMNLAVNAKDAMHDGGTLTVATGNVQLDEEFCKVHVGAKPGAHVYISVRDTGRGMDKETQSHIFEPFYTTKGTGMGTGLGLAMVYGIVKNHGGYISCESTRKKGTEFRIYIPVIQQEALSEEEVEEALPRGGSETVLLIDDEKLIRDLGEKALTGFGYTVLTAPNGESALKLYNREFDQIDLVILDLIMPKMSGTHCFEEIKSINPEAKVIIASGYSDEGTVHESLKERANRFIDKPFNVKGLLRMIREVLDGS